MQRVGYHSQEINHAKVANELIDKALKRGFAYLEVENGVFYFVKTANTKFQDTLVNLFQKIGEEDIQFTFIYYLNTLKNEERWINYFPFTLSIEKPDNVYNFLVGEIQFVVFISFSAIQNYAKKKGSIAKITSNKDGIEFSDTNSQYSKKGFDLGNHFLGRAAYDFTSLKWILDETFLQYRDFHHKDSEF